MKRQLFSVIIFTCFLFLGVFVFAQTPDPNSLIVVGTNSCSETDGGLDYFNVGSVTGSFWWYPSVQGNVTGNQTTNTTQVSNFTGTFTDTCISNTVLAEVVCGSSVDSSFNSLAGALLVYCNYPNSAYGCVNGACVYVGNSTNSTTNSSGGTGSGGGGNGTIGNSTNSTTNSSSLIPNLIISGVSWNYTSNGSVMVNGTNVTRYFFLVNVAVSNNGNSQASSSVTNIGFKMNTGPFASNYVYQQTSTPSLTPGQSVVLSRTFIGYSGQFNIEINVDSSNQITELNELDNQAIVANYLP